MALLPPITDLHRDGTHRLIPSRYAENEQDGLTRLTANVNQLNNLSRIEAATSYRIAGEANRLPAIRVDELVPSNIPYARIINAAFTNPHPAGSRFNGPERGAWYAAFALETAQAEVMFHKAQELRERKWPKEFRTTYVDFLADFHCDFYDLRNNAMFASCLDHKSYHQSRALARELFEKGGAGVVYNSARHETGTCLACFRPTLVQNVRRADELVFLFFPDEFKAPQITVIKQK